VRILIVEDDLNKRQQLVDFLKSSGTDNELTERSSYQSGLKAALSGRFDVILLDMTMPTFDRSENEPSGKVRHFAGRDFLEQMKLRGLAMPVIVFTGFETFGEEGERMSIEALRSQLSLNFGEVYVAMVYYHPGITTWKAALTAALKLVNNRGRNATNTSRRR
jgi:CheY-like chemotaxis protein